MIDTATDAFVSMDADGLVTEWNRRAEEVFGWTKAEVLGARLEEFMIPEEHRTAYREGLRRFVAGGDGPVLGQTLQLSALRRTGEEFPVELTIWATPSDDRLTFNAFLCDISDRVAFEVVRARFEAVFDSSDDAITLVDPAGIVLAWNPAAERIYGYRAEEMVGHNAADVLAVPDQEEARAHAADRLARGLPAPAEVRCVRKDGTPIVVAVTRSPIVDRDGEIVAVTGVSRDITESKRAEQALAESEERFRQLADTATDLVVRVGQDGTFLYVSPSVSNVLGWAPADLVGRRFTDIIDPDTSPIDELEARVERPDGVERRLLRARRADGGWAWCESASQPTVDPDSGATVVQASVRDVTPRVEAERALAARTDALARSNAELARSNADLEDFAAVVAHDLKSPLATVGGFASMLETGLAGELSEDGQQYAGYVVQGVQRMQTLVDDLLAYARVGTRAERHHVELRTVIDDVAAFLAAQLDATGAQLVVDDTLPAVVGDDSQLRQLFMNLIGNAVKFRRADTPPRVEVTASCAGGRVQIAVTDNGIGIDPKFRDRVFKMFQRLHTADDYPGTGIGLAICRRVVENHGGIITVDGALGGGTVFRFDLPAGQP